MADDATGDAAGEELLTLENERAQARRRDERVGEVRGVVVHATLGHRLTQHRPGDDRVAVAEGKCRVALGVVQRCAERPEAPLLGAARMLEREAQLAVVCHGHDAMTYPGVR